MSFTIINSPEVVPSDSIHYVLLDGQTATASGVGEALIEITGHSGTQISINGTGRSQTDAAITADAASSNTLVSVGVGGILHGATAGVSLLGSAETVLNGGKIAGNSFGVFLDCAGGGVANSGVIRGGVGLSAAGSDLTLENGGYIHGRVAGASVDGPGDTLSNYGRIVGHMKGVLLGDATILNNSGRIVGKGGVAVQGDGGASEVLNSGTIVGRVQLGGGDDEFVALGNGTVSGAVKGGGGADILAGGSGKDVLIGGNGDDGLLGWKGKDVLRGGGGSDSIGGLQGDDKLFGGGGADHFVYTAKTAFLSAHSGHDRIMDWEDGTDVIDLFSVGIAAGEQHADVNNAVSNHHGNAIIDLSAFGHGMTGTVVVVGAAHQIGFADFLFA